MNQNIHSEISYQQRQAEMLDQVIPTPAATIARYRQTPDWRIYPKEFMFHRIRALAPKRVCDFGCGAGETSVELGALGYAVVGLDLSPDLIALAQRRAELDLVTDRVEFVVAEANPSALPKASFDLVLVQAVLHHMDIAQGIATLLAMLKPGGHVVIMEPVVLSSAMRWLRRHIPVAADLSLNERQLEWLDIRSVESGFEVVEKRFFHLGTRLLRCVPERFIGHRTLSYALHALDQALIRGVPGLYRWAGILVFVGRKK